MNGPNAVIVVGLLLLVIAMLFIYRATRSPTALIDIADAFLEGHPRRLTMRRLLEPLAFWATTCVLFWLAATDKLTAEYFWCYNIVWPLRAISGPVMTAWAARMAPNGRTGE